MNKIYFLIAINFAVYFVFKPKLVIAEIEKEDLLDLISSSECSELNINLEKLIEADSSPWFEGGFILKDDLSVKKGGYTGSGGDIYPVYYGAAWNTGNEPVYYCINKSPEFPFEKDQANKLIKNSIAKWDIYLKEHDIDTYIQDKINERMRGNNKETSEKIYKHVYPNINVNYKYVESCDERTDLVFFLGTKAPLIEDAVNKFEDPLAFSLRLGFDREYYKQTGKSKGYIWIANDKKLKFKSEIKPNQWTSLKEVEALILHELGHVMGISHVKGTIMDENLSDYVRDDWKIEELLKIDAFNMLLAKSCTGSKCQQFFQTKLDIETIKDLSRVAAPGLFESFTQNTLDNKNCLVDLVLTHKKDRFCPACDYQNNYASKTYDVILKCDKTTITHELKYLNVIQAIPTEQRVFKHIFPVLNYDDPSYYFIDYSFNSTVATYMALLKTSDGEKFHVIVRENPTHLTQFGAPLEINLVLTPAILEQIPLFHFYTVWKTGTGTSLSPFN